MTDDLPGNLDQDELLQFHLIRAEHHLQRALDTVYTTRGPIRSLLYRLRLMRAQNSALVLYKKELRMRKEKLPQPETPDPGKEQS